MNQESQDKKEFVIETKQQLQKETQMQSQLVESGGEFVLPDYMPMMQKVLRLEARALPPTRFVGANSVQMSGEVLHTLIYLGEDGETGATVLPSKYEFQIPLDEHSTPNITAAVEVDGLTYRLTAPRKLSIRTRLSAKPHCIEKEDITAEIRPSDADINRLYGEINSIKTSHLHSTDAEVTDRINIGSAKEQKLLWCGASAAVTDARAVDGGVNIRGDVLAKVLAEGDGSIKMYTKKIPFDEFLEGEVSRGDYACAMAHVVSTEAVKEDGGEAEVTVSLFVEATADSPIKLTVLKDAFSSDYETQNEYKKVNSMRIAKAESGIYTVGASIAKAAAGISDVDTVIDTSGRAAVEEITAKDGKLNVAGRCELSSLFFGGNEYTSAQYSVPFNLSVDCDTAEDVTVSAMATLVSPRVRVENDNLVCDMDIALTLRGIKKNEENILSAVECMTNKKYIKSAYPLCLIYPGGESLWDLAKKYHVSPESLAEVNSLDIAKDDYRDPSVLSKIRSLMLEFK